jgi:hypothetical protein
MQEKLAGEIRADCAYTIREFCRRTGIGRERVTERFTVRRMANKRFVLGRDFIEALFADEPTKTPSSAASPPTVPLSPEPSGNCLRRHPGSVVRTG